MFLEQMMYHAIDLSKKAEFHQISPNPFVGAVVCDSNHTIIGEGYHAKYGGPHAEVHAIQNAMQVKSDLSDCILFVTLEPCSHHGKTPPCTDLIIRTGIKQVVIGSYDPNPLVSGKKILEEQGISVSEMILPEAIELNKVFFTNHKKKRPFVQLKAAVTLDGKIADRYNDSKWISSKESRAIVHQRLRTHTDAIFTTYKTVIHDNATLNIRIDEMESKELNVVCIDRELHVLKNNGLNIFYPRVDSTLYLVTDTDETNELQLPPHVQILNVPFYEDGSVNMDYLGKELLQKNICHLLVEAGNQLSTSLLKSNWLDEIVVFVAPKILHDVQSKSLFHTSDAMKISEAKNLKLKEVEKIQDDVMLTYSFHD